MLFKELHLLNLEAKADWPSWISMAFIMPESFPNGYQMLIQDFINIFTASMVPINDACTCINDGWLIISVSPSSDSEVGPIRRDVKYWRKTYKLKKK